MISRSKVVEEFRKKAVEEGLGVSRRAIVRLYDARFDPVPENVQALVMNETDPNELEDWSIGVAMRGHQEVLGLFGLGPS